MSEKHLGKALLGNENGIDPGALTDEILRRDRRRTWLLAIVCVVAWLLVVLLPWATILPMLARVVDHASAFNPPAADATSTAEREDSILMLQIVRKGTIATFVGSTLSMFVASTSTVAFILLSRRATMRQVNMQLRAISDQLRTLGGGQ